MMNEMHLESKEIILLRVYTFLGPHFTDSNTKQRHGKISKIVRMILY